MLKFCNWIAGRFGYRIMKVQIFKCSEATWTMPLGLKTVTVEAGGGGAASTNSTTNAFGGGGGNG